MVGSWLDVSRLAQQFKSKMTISCFLSLQRAPCGLDGGSSKTITTQEEQEERLLYMAQFADAKIRADVLNDVEAASFLEDHVQLAGVLVRNRSDHNE